MCALDCAFQLFQLSLEVIYVTPLLDDPPTMPQPPPPQGDANALIDDTHALVVASIDVT